MPSFIPKMYDLAKRIEGKSRGVAVKIAIEEYNLSEAGAHAAISMFIGSNGFIRRGKNVSLADALTTELERDLKRNKI